MDRREFLTAAGGTLLAAGACSAGVLLLTHSRRGLPGEGLVGSSSEQRFGMLIDLTQCDPECDECLKACRHENNVALHGDERWDIHWLRKVKIRSKASDTAPEHTVLLVCNHCDHPPCAQVCPVRATYKRADGIVLVDHHRCIGCRYCVISCPYNARYFTFKENEEWPNKEYPKRSHGVAESCNLCAHLLDRGQAPACVDACAKKGNHAIAVGDLNAPEDGEWYGEPRLRSTKHTPKRLREDLGTEPKVYYFGLP